MSENEKFVATFEYKLIYVFRINDVAHKGVLKIGDATLKTNKKYNAFQPSCHELNAAAKKRIDEYTVTAGITYELLYTEIAVYLDSINNLKAFRDHMVHNVLKRSGVKNVYFDKAHRQNEWFECDLETAKKAIKAVKDGKTALDGCEITTNQSPIILRPEQEDAISKTIKQFGVSHHMLWNAKMRFGKTLSALELVKRMKFNKTIIITHRPDVDAGWFEDFGKIFYEKDTDYSYGSKNNGKTIKELIDSNKPFIYFASIQDLRGSEKAGGKFDKNNEVFGVKWDLVVTDEAHEGTQTELGKNVRSLLINDNNYDLSLSGTPFNLFDLYSNDDTYTWDYIMEQKAKYDWMKNPEKLGDSNPYEELPKLNIFTYQLEKLIPTDFDLEDKAFNFKEFFRTWTGNKEKDYTSMPSNANIGDFVHEDAVKAFLDLLCKKSDETNYPFSTEEYRDFFRHTLWMIPGVKEAKALTELLKKHPVFQNFTVVNVAGDGDDDFKEEQKARNKLYKAMTKHPEDTRTITLSCGRLTTGVTVKEWTAVLMLYGTYMTDAKTYLQTIFRVQSPGNLNGRIKENCYVFDFAPDRTLRVVYDSMQKMSKRREPKIEVAKLLGEFLNFCPVISLSEVSNMREFSANELLQEVKRVYAERVVESGFEDRCLYDELKLKQLDQNALDKFEELRKIIGKTNQTKKTSVVVNENDLTEEQRKEQEELEKKKKEKKQLSEEEKKRLEELKKLQNKKQTAISILRGISIRIPLLVYGMDIDYSADITIDEIANKIDDVSWTEFMPAGVTKAVFKDFIEYYDKDIFVRSCRSIRTISKQCDDLEPTERIKKLTTLFSKFKNPDKETVLTPWRVVNMHMAQTIGGYCFYNDDYSKEIDEPRFVNIENVTENIFTDEGKVLEINSKTGLYPLYVAYSFYRTKLNERDLSFEEKKKIWNEVVENNVYVICKTEMAKQITRRTLLGYTNGKMNAHAFDDLVNQMKEKQQQLVDNVLRPKFWNKGGQVMKFNAVVGNPPYQGVNHQQVYPNFYLTSLRLGEYVSLIFPVGWQQPKNANNLACLNNKSVKQDKQIVFIDNRQNVFPGISGAEWVNIVLWNKKYDNGYDGAQLIYTNGMDGKIEMLPIEMDTIKKPNEIIEISNIVFRQINFKSMSSIVSSNRPYGLRKDVFSRYEYYNLPEMSEQKINDDDIIVYGSNERIRYAKKNYPFTKASHFLNYYKVFIPSAWGNMSENAGLGGSWSNIILGLKNTACTETFNEIGPFDSKNQALFCAKYVMTKFARSLIYMNKLSRQCSKDAYKFLPIQDYSEDWWNLSISEINEKLFDKYNIPQNIRDFVNKNFQTKYESNIVNYE